MAFASLPVDRWGHVHVQPTRVFTAALTLMARTGAAQVLRSKSCES